MGLLILFSNADRRSRSQKTPIQIPDFLKWAFIQSSHGTTGLATV